jgi:uncharacterized membrane protein YfcA
MTCVFMASYHVRMPDPLWTYPALCVAAFLAGAVNSVAGGGTLLTFPALMASFAPLGPEAAATLANGTSTVALMPGSLSGAVGYRHELRECVRFVGRMFLPSLVGGFVGAWLVGQAPNAFAALVPWLILTAAVLFLVQAPLSNWLKRRAAAAGKQPDHEAGWKTQAAVIGFQFLVAVYGGYFGAGIGILMLSALGFMGVGDIHRMNAVKTFLAAVINGASVVVFVWYRLVNWEYAAPMAVAAILGGYAGARVARRLPVRIVRYAVIAIGFSLATYYFVREYV